MYAAVEHADAAPADAHTIGAGNGIRRATPVDFDKPSRGAVRKSSKCDMDRTRNGTDRVYGVLFSVARAEEKALDKPSVGVAS